ncbi:MAG: hypothetical protein M5U19_08845 [Microthrixaceae bacterium]|nr:hypothetical protein [Microthrixaceae bacterium]
MHPEVIRSLARDVAGGRTKILEGFNTPKYYHGDLMERSMILLLALTGNWGKPGAGIQGLALAGFDGYLMFSMKSGSGVDETARILDGLDSAMETLRSATPIRATRSWATSCSRWRSWPGPPRRRCSSTATMPATRTRGTKPSGRIPT